ncbi:hypothetical protein Salat_2100200 [Sesamum alatum]|uniref:Uncharacterized protein n=1 Tax=Sesamum alatum TaxID=300844 RepID=A0AAE1Y0G2_9LAMI|nr:hypothetical protein Salat_2100200 [Sesamum alatum]
MRGIYCIPSSPFTLYLKAYPPFFISSSTHSFPRLWKTVVLPLTGLHRNSSLLHLLPTLLVDYPLRSEAKAFLDTDLSVVATLHPAEEIYRGLESPYSRLRKGYNEPGGILKFLPDDLPLNPLSSSNTRVRVTPACLLTPEITVAMVEKGEKMIKNQEAALS